MENSVDFMKLGVVLAIVAALIASVLIVFNLGKTKVTTATESLTKATSDLEDSDLTVYDGTSIQGAEVINVINKYKEEPTFYINVVKKSQKESAAYKAYGLGMLYGHAGNHSGVKFIPKVGSSVTDEVSMNDTTDLVVKLELGSPADTDGDVPKGCVASKIPDGKTTDGKTTLAYAKEYNTTWTSDKEWYIPEGKVFKGSIQRDSDGNITLITFVQQ